MVSQHVQIAMYRILVDIGPVLAHYGMFTGCVKTK